MKSDCCLNSQSVLPHESHESMANWLCVCECVRGNGFSYFTSIHLSPMLAWSEGYCK